MTNQEQLSLLKSDLSAWNDWRDANPIAKIDFSGADLSGADLSEVNLSYADLTGANLKGATLNFTNLTGATLINANLSLIKADRPVIACASLEQANLCGAWIRGADMRSSFFAFADARDATFRKCDMQQCDFVGTNFSGSNFYGTDMTDCWVDHRANFSGSDLNGTIGFATTSGNYQSVAVGVILDERTIFPGTILDEFGRPSDLSPDPDSD